MSFYVLDPSPEMPDKNMPVICGGYPDTTLYGKFTTYTEANGFANASHPDEESGAAVVLVALDEWEETETIKALKSAADPSVTKDGE